MNTTTDGAVEAQAEGSAAKAAFGALPARGDGVATWLKRWRDGFREVHDVTSAEVVDRLLAEYRMKADYGLRLDEGGGDP